MFPLLLSNVVALIIQFDGSLRVPHDPNPEIVPSSVSSKFLPPLASCSSVLLLRDAFDDCDEVPDISSTEEMRKHENILALDFKILLDDIGFTTSANVEYEGLLSGLNLLLNYFEGLTLFEISIKYSTIRVQGDCKTVIDQMNGVSIPRKQREYFERVSDLVQDINAKYKTNFSFEHILRERNELCDSICYEVIQSYQMTIIKAIDSRIEEIVSKDRIKLPSSKKRRLKFRETHFSTLIDDLSIWDQRSCSRIPLSIRPYWLGKVALHAEQVNDFVAIRLIGEALINESKQWQKEGLSYDKNLSLRDEMILVGNLLVVFSLQNMDLRKEAMKVGNERVDEIDKNNDDVMNQLKHFVGGYNPFGGL